LADEVVADVEKTFPGRKSFIVRDEKTASGRVHVGSLRGVVIHGIAAQALREKGYDVKYYYEFNEYRPHGRLPVYLNKEKYLPYMGFPLRMIPRRTSTEILKKQHLKKILIIIMRDFMAKEFESVIRRLGFAPIFYYNSELYSAAIRRVD